jgi:hypothetical protein
VLSTARVTQPAGTIAQCLGEGSGRQGESGLHHCNKSLVKAFVRVDQHGSAQQKFGEDVETSRNGSIRSGHYCLGVGRLQKSLCSSEALPADEGGLGRIGHEDAARSRAAEMDAAAKCSDAGTLQTCGHRA